MPSPGVFPSSLESDKPFLSRARTREAIDELSAADRMLIYAGAGVTIDRSNLNWRGLVDGLLSQYVVDPSHREDIFSSHSVLEAASLAIEYFRKDYGVERHLERIVDRLRLMLYGPGDWQAGILADSLARLCKAYAEQRQGCLTVTPNYDDYIVEALSNVFGSAGVRFTTETDFLHDQADNARSASWVGDKSEIAALYLQGNACLQLHGLIPRDDNVNSGKFRTPVIGELDYVRSEQYTYRALRSLLRESPALFVGTSLTDRPLLRALSRTLDSGYERYALIPVGLELDRDRQRALRSHTLERFQHFGVTPIYVDYYFQIAQFLEELSLQLTRPMEVLHSGLQDFAVSSVKEDDTGAISVQEPVSLSYGKRLAAWSNEWVQLENRTDVDSSTISSGILDFVQDEVREILDISASEVTKVELWVRDSPVGFRGLRLWRSTVSLHLQEESVRRAPFSNNSEIAAIQAFTAGRPVVSSLRDDESPNQRWRTYIASPIWLDPERGRYGRLPVGAFVLASMRQSESSGLFRFKRRHAMKEAMNTLLWFGELLTSIEE